MKSMRIMPTFAAALALSCCSCASDEQSGSGKAHEQVAGHGGSPSGGAGVSAGGATNGASGSSSPAANSGTGGTNEQQPRVLMTIDDCPGTLAADVVQRLQGPNVQPGATKWLYPYDQTVLPRGLIAPVLQWEKPQAGADAVFIHLHSMFLDHKICLPLTEPMRVQIPQSAWDLAGAQSTGRTDPLTVDVVLSSAGNALALATRTLSFALADLKGAIYYNTYGSRLAQQAAIVGGVVMRILPHEPEPEVFATATGTGECIGCHAVSADGRRMVAEVHTNGGSTEGMSRLFDLTTVGNGTNPIPLRSDLRRAGFSGIYPDGSVYVTTARATAGPLGGGSLNGGATVVTGTFGPEETKLFNADDGTELTGSGVHPYAYMPTFSSDGSELVFNKMDTSGTSGHTLATMAFDHASHTFSALKEIFDDPAKFPAWPFFLPDVVEALDDSSTLRGKRVLFSLGSNADFVTAAFGFGAGPATSDLWWLDVDSGMAAPLARANGEDNGQVYLPAGAAEAHKSFVPTVSPVAAGGYFWVFFTSRRSYGNLMPVDPVANAAEAKKIWVAAIDIEAAPGSDPSHPAFYLPNQELESGNLRAFAALEPCRQNESACSSGIDCCCGFCIEGQCACKPEDGCANLDEKCATAADCCDAGAACIGGFCQTPGPD